MKFASTLCAALALTVAGSAWAINESQSFQVKNRLRAEYDDNIYETASDKQDSFKIIEELEFLVNLNLQQTFIGLRYRPSFIWWEDRDPDNEDFQHEADVMLTHKFSPRLSLSLKDTLRIAELAELIDRGTTIRERDDYVYNVADAVLSYQVARDTRLEAAGRYTLLRYDSSEVAEVEDYDIYAAGLNLRHELSKDTAVGVELRHEMVSYDGPDRDSDSEYGGLALEQIFSPNLLANVRGGVQYKQYDADGLDSETAPYAEASMTFLPTPAARLTAGAGYSLFESDIYPFSSQERALAFVSAAIDLSARVSLYLAGSIQNSGYDADTAIDSTVVTDIDNDDVGEVSSVDDGDEQVAQLSARASYKLNRSNWLELGWQYLKLDSDFRSDFERNRVELGWRTQL